MGRCRVRHQRHVGGFDRLPPGDRRSVEGVSVSEHAFVDATDVGGDVLHLAFCVREFEIHELCFLVLDELQDVTRVLHRHSPV